MWWNLQVQEEDEKQQKYHEMAFAPRNTNQANLASNTSGVSAIHPSSYFSSPSRYQQQNQQQQNLGGASSSSSSSPSRMMNTSFSSWLGEQMNSQYGKYFKRSGFDSLDVLSSLTESQLHEFVNAILPPDIPLGHKFFLTNKVEELRRHRHNKKFTSSASASGSGSASISVAAVKRGSSPVASSSLIWPAGVSATPVAASQALASSSSSHGGGGLNSSVIPVGATSGRPANPDKRTSSFTSTPRQKTPSKKPKPQLGEEKPRWISGKGKNDAQLARSIPQQQQHHQYQRVIVSPPRPPILGPSTKNQNSATATTAHHHHHHHRSPSPVYQSNVPTPRVISTNPNFQQQRKTTTTPKKKKNTAEEVEGRMIRKAATPTQAKRAVTPPSSTTTSGNRIHVQHPPRGVPTTRIQFPSSHHHHQLTTYLGGKHDTQSAGGGGGLAARAALHKQQQQQQQQQFYQLHGEGGMLSPPNFDNLLSNLHHAPPPAAASSSS